MTQQNIHHKLLLTFALAIWPAGHPAIGRKECYWAVVPADGNPLGSIFLPEK